jgi:hypothetical protein
MSAVWAATACVPCLTGTFSAAGSSQCTQAIVTSIVGRTTPIVVRRGFAVKTQMSISLETSQISVLKGAAASFFNIPIDAVLINAKVTLRRRLHQMSVDMTVQFETQAQADEAKAKLSEANLASFNEYIQKYGLPTATLQNTPVLTREEVQVPINAQETPKPSEESTSNTATMGIIIGAVVGGLALVAVIVLVVVSRQNKSTYDVVQTDSGVSMGNAMTTQGWLKK